MEMAWLRIGEELDKMWSVVDRTKEAICHQSNISDDVKDGIALENSLDVIESMKYSGGLPSIDSGIEQMVVGQWNRRYS